MTYKYNSELSNDDSKLQDSIFWKRKEQFALLMENLVTDSIDMEEFKIGFSLLLTDRNLILFVKAMIPNLRS